MGINSVRKSDPTLVWEQLLAKPRRSKGSLAMQLVASFIDAIDSKQIPEGVRVPSSRAISEHLGVGRNTAISAITTLMEQGYLVSKDRSGVFVAPTITLTPASVPAWAGSDAFDWNARLGLCRPDPNGGSEEAPKTLVTHNFKYGQFDLSTFPTFHWRQCERSASGLSEIAQWGRDMFDRDDAELVESLRRHVLPNHGIWAEPEDILVTLGGQEGRYLVAQLLSKPGVTIGVENPGLPDVSEMVSATSAGRVCLPVDEEGVCLSPELKQCDVAFIMPGHQCPTTAVMSLERREKVLELAKRRDMIIVEDTYETELLSYGKMTPSLKSLDREGRVIHIGSLSKAVAPGLRLGFVVAAPVVIRELRSIRRLVHRHPPGNIQRALAMFIDRGYYHSYIRRVSQTLASRTKIFFASVKRHLPYVTMRHHEGAASFWAEFPSSVDAGELCREMAARGILIESGARFFLDGPKNNYLRMAVSQVPENKIDSGIATIAQAI
ncbi:PLP-dependent aminotransferase family protein [Mesorhizobium sp. M1216]|uniref:aminotransferase-like domain-containing protein n=1 Tax=Mesorhizobium sp. M1216 TaxID=2957069 RepID=UPI003337F721